MPATVDDMRVCSNSECSYGGELQPINDFYMRQAGGNTRHARCKTCMNAVAARSGSRPIEVAPGYFIKAYQVSHWQRYYNLKPLDVLSLYLEQEARCLICKRQIAWLTFNIHHDHGYPGCKQSKRGDDYDCPSASVWGLTCEWCNKLEGQRIADPVAYDSIAAWHAKNNGGRKLREDIAS